MWLRLIALPENLKTCEPKALRYRFLHVPARLTKGARRRHLAVPSRAVPPPATPTPDRSRVSGASGLERTEVPVLQGKLGLADGLRFPSGRHSVGEAYFVVGRSVRHG